MSAQDPDVRPDLERALTEEIERKEQRIRLLEAQLAQASRTADNAALPQTPSPAATRPPIRLPVFDGAPVSVIADRVQALANARNAPSPAAMPPLSAALPTPAAMPSDAADTFEPTARLDARELRHAHRALPRVAAHRGASAALLCLGTATLWGGIWQMRLREQQHASRSALQNATDAPALADARLPGATPIILPEAEPRTKDSLPADAAASAGAERAGQSLPPSTYTARQAAPPAVSFSPPPHASLAADEIENRRLPAPAQPDPPLRPTLKPERKAALATYRQRTLAQTAPTETGFRERIAANRKTRLVMPTATREYANHKITVGNAWALRPSTSALREQDIAFTRAQPSSPHNTYGIGESGSHDTQEQSEEQTETVRVPHSAASARAESANDIEANVDHAMQTLNKMRELLDGMDKNRKTPAHP